MAGFQGIKDLESEISNGKYHTDYFSKIGNANAGTAGNFEQWFTSTGFPGPITFSGTAGVATQLTNTTVGALSPLSEGNVSTDNRYLLNFQISTSATTITPGFIVLLDLLLYYPGLVFSTTTPTTLDNTASLPRYTNGVGVVAVGFNAVAAGTSTPPINGIFTDNNGNASQTIDSWQAGRANPPACLAENSTTNFPFASLNGSTSGVTKMNSYTTTVSTTGSVCIVLCKPLAMIPINAQSITTETDFVNQFISLPQIQDGACLGMLLVPGGARAASAPMVGSLTYGWG